MLNNEEVQDHLNVLRIAFDPKSPFRGMIDMEGDGGLRALTAAWFIWREEWAAGSSVEEGENYAYKSYKCGVTTRSNQK